MKISGTAAQRGLTRCIRDLVDGDSVLRALTTEGYRQMPGMIVESMESRDWASLTFTGEVHKIGFRLSGGGEVVAAARARLDQLLKAAELVVAGHIVAEIAVVDAVAEGRGVSITVEALTLQD